MGPTPQYSADSFQVMNGVEHVRRHPEMYVGPLPNPAVVNEFTKEAMCLGVDAAACGRCPEITVRTHRSGEIAVRMLGAVLQPVPGMDVLTMVEHVLTKVGGCREAKQDKRARTACCGVGLTVVTILSERLRARVFHDGSAWLQEYRFGEVQAPFRREGETAETGLELAFLPDTAILGPQSFDLQPIADWLPTTGVRVGSVERRVGDSADGEATVHRFRGLVPASDG